MGSRIGDRLNRELALGAQHALYRRDGRWYHHLQRFPGVLFDLRGYVIFPTKEAYLNCGQLPSGKELNVVGGIASIPGYVRDDRILLAAAQKWTKTTGLKLAIGRRL